MGNDPETLTTQEAATFLRLSPYTVRELARRGEVPARKVGKQWRFSKRRLSAWLEAREREEETVWVEAASHELGERLKELEYEGPVEESELWLEMMERAARPARYVPGRGLIVEW